MIKFNFLKLIVDIGNSRTKLALFDKKHLVKHEITSNFSKDSLSNFCDNYLVNSSIFSSVLFDSVDSVDSESSDFSPLSLGV